MSDIFEGIGSATEGGLFARALEPDSGKKEPHPDQPENCLNCGTALTGAYCHACGQSGHIHRTIGAFMHDLLHGALHFEGKFWHTLPMLVFKPGKLTRRYIEGQRARFVSPMALFLFAVFLMFAVFQMVGITAPTDLRPDQVFEETLEQASENALAEIATIEEQLLTGELSETERAELEERKGVLELFLQDNPASAATWREFAQGLADGARPSGPEADAPTAEASAEEPLEAGDEIIRTDLADFADTQMTVNATGVGVVDEALSKWNDNPSLMLYKLQANAYKFSWLLIPISIPFVWLLFFWKRRFKAYDHAIFVTYSLSFVTMLFIAASVLGKSGLDPAILIIAMILIPPLHMYKQLRGAYEIGRFSAFWRLIVLSGFIWVIIGLFVQLLLLIGAF